MEQVKNNIARLMQQAKGQLAPLCGIGVLLVGVLVCYFYLQQIQRSANQNQQQAIAQAQAQALPPVIENLLNGLQQKLTDVMLRQDSAAILNKLNEASDPSIGQALEQQQLTWLQATAASIYQPQQAQRNADATPPVSYVTLELIKRAESNNPAPAEALRLNKKWQFFLSVSHRQNDTNIATLLASYDLSLLRNSLKSRLEKGASVQLIQQFEGAKPQVILQIGSSENSSNKVELSTNNPNWQLHYYPIVGAVQSSAININDIIVITALISIFLLLSALVPWFITQQQIKRDSDQLTHYLAALMRAEAASAPSLQHPAMYKLLDDIQDLSGDFATGMVQVKAAPAPANAKKDEDFSAIDDLELDPSDAQLLAIADSVLPSAETDAIEDDFEESEILAEPDPVAEAISEPDGRPVHEPEPAPNNEIFRAYDIRGIVGENLDNDIAETIGRAIATRATELHISSMVVAADGRESSPELCQSLIRGLRQGGISVVHIGMVATPLLYFATETLETNSGVMVTGSHNPADHNGFKIVLNGAALVGEEIQQLAQLIQQQNFSSGNGELTELDVEEAYINRISNDIAIAQPLRVVIDCGNGVTGKTAPKLFEAIGCEVIPLYTDIDGQFPNHHPDPSKVENLNDLIATVQQNQADIGIAFDGDGDRLGVVTESGTIIWPDRLLMLFAKDIVSRNPGADVIYDVKCTRLLNAFISGYGGRPIMWKTGHSMIKAKMRETGALLGGEMSGHIFIKERWYGFDDGLYSAARLLEILSTESRTADTLFDAFPNSVATPEITIAIAEKEKFTLVENLIANSQWPDGNIITLDGLRVDFSDGWGLLRASNTTANLVLRFEADNDDALERIQQLFYSQLQQLNPQLTLPA